MPVRVLTKICKWHDRGGQGSTGEASEAGKRLGDERWWHQDEAKEVGRQSYKVISVSCTSSCNTHARACARCRFEGRAWGGGAGGKVCSMGVTSHGHVQGCPTMPCMLPKRCAAFSVSHCPKVAPRMCAAMQMHHLSTVRFLAAPATTAAHACRIDPCGFRRAGSPYPGCGAPAWLLLALEARREGSTRGEERLVG